MSCPMLTHTDWHQPGTGERDDEEGKRRRYRRAREEGRRGGGVKWGPVLQRQCRGNTMQMQHNAVALGEALQMRQGKDVQEKAATPSPSQARGIILVMHP